MEDDTQKQQAHALIDRLDPSQTTTALRFLQFMLLDPLSHSIATAPPEDEQLTEEEQESAQRAELWFQERGGKGIPHEEVLAEFGLTPSDFPLQRNGS